MGNECEFVTNFGNVLIARLFTASTSKSASLSNGSRLNGQIIALYEKFKIGMADFKTQWMVAKL